LVEFIVPAAIHSIAAAAAASNFIKPAAAASIATANQKEHPNKRMQERY